ncbi:peroxiredoxin-like family protein [Streptomyces sp. NPDC008222]|uniref:peroxiredoxin-like family protein n=1 Tax=Streptomyces sp. NPDC008222 TaxID=3364820 RepID=UPI0036E8E0BA
MTTANSTLAEQVAVLVESMAKQVSAHALKAFGDEQAGLDAAGAPEGTAMPGTPMPDGDLLDVHGKPTSLTQARAGKPAVVVFYRGAWCPYCNVALRVYQAQLVPALAERSVSLIAISPQKPDGSLSVQETNELTFTVVSDPGNQIAKRLGILTSPTAEAREALGLDLTEINADGTYTVPMPTTVIVDAGGTIRWIDIHPNYATRTESHQILHELDSILA